MTMRPASLADMQAVLDWAAAEGWNPGLDDAAAFLAADPQGIFVAERDGRPVAAITVVNHDDSHAFLGLYLCRPEYRGQGIGHALWRHALAHAGSRTVGLDGVAAQQGNYAKSGFVRTGASQRFTGSLVPATDHEIRAVTDGDIPGLIARDAAAGGIERAPFLSAWLRPTQTRRAVMTRDGQAFAVIRRCREGGKIGPIVARDATLAQRLARAALAELPCAPVSIDLPESNTGLRARLEAEGFTLSFETARMFRGPPPVTRPELQAIATMELG